MTLLGAAGELLFDEQEDKASVSIKKHKIRRNRRSRADELQSVTLCFGEVKSEKLLPTFPRTGRAGAHY